MATKEQYEFFKLEYNEENTRNNELTKRAEVYFSIVSIFLTALLFKIKDTIDFINSIGDSNIAWMLIAALVCFSVSLYLIINSLKIRNYEGVADFDSYIDSNNIKDQSDTDFFDDRVVDYIVAIRRNEIVNDSKANQLIWSRVFVLAGLFITVIFIVYSLIINNQIMEKKKEGTKPTKEAIATKTKPGAKKTSMDESLAKRNDITRSKK